MENINSPELLNPFFRGGEKSGGYLWESDVIQTLTDALQTALFNNVHPLTPPKPSLIPDKTYNSNLTFWNDAISDRHFPGAIITLDGFDLTEWIPFAPGRYYTREAQQQRMKAGRHFEPGIKEYTPEGKSSMIRGGIGSIRLSDKNINGNRIYFLGASSTGIAHQGIPVALELEEYRKVMPIIKENGGCKVKLVGRLQSLDNSLPKLQFDRDIPRYCFFVEEVLDKKVSNPRNLLATASIMFSTDVVDLRDFRRDSKNSVFNKSWTFCSFQPGSNIRPTVEWLMDYAVRYSNTTPTILTDFDEHSNLFSSRVEFPISSIIKGDVDLETLRVYNRGFGNTFIETYIAEYTKEKIVVEKQINVDNSGIGNITNIAEYMSGVTNTVYNNVNQSNTSDEIKDLIKELTERITAVAPQIETKTAEKLGKNVEALSKEVASTEPDRRWYEVSLSGLKEAAVAVGELGKPILETISKLTPLLLPIIS